MIVRIWLVQQVGKMEWELGKWHLIMNNFSVVEISTLRYIGEHILKLQEIHYEEIEYEERQINRGFLPGGFPLLFELWLFE